MRPEAERLCCAGSQAGVPAAVRSDVLTKANSSPFGTRERGGMQTLMNEGG